MTSHPNLEPTFPEWLKRRRQELDLTQDRLAELVGYASPTIQKIERGERRPSRELAARLADALEIPAEERATFLRLARSPSEPGLAQVTGDTHGQAVAVQAGWKRAPALPSPVGPLLRTRIQPPPPRRQGIPRPRLAACLDHDQGGTVTLVVAPAGWGKTTLLSLWIAGLPPEERRWVTWLAIDQSDSEPVRLLRYVIATLQQAEPTLGAAAQALLDTPEPALHVALALLINDLAGLTHPVRLIFDDYHLLRAPAAHQVLTFLVEQLPQQLLLIITTRENPPLPLSRLRARGQLHEIRAADLRFTTDEAAHLLNDTMGLTLDPQAIAALEQRTEGWAAGLQLAALALRGQGDQAGFIHNFIGSHRLVLDYLAEEVLDRLPGHIHTFLLQTSILDRLCGPLCDAVLGVGSWGSGDGEHASSPNPQPVIPNLQAYSQLILDDLERANLFLVPLDETRSWYRYHHLFGEVLRAQLQRGANPAVVKGLHGRAAAWFAAQGLWHDVLLHAQAAQQWDLAGQALERIGNELMLQGAFGRLSQLIDSSAWPARHPRLLLLQGLCEAKNFNMPAAQALLTQSAALFESTGDVAGRGEALLHLADCQRSSGGFAAAHATLQEALAAPLPPGTRINALISRAYEALAIGDWPGSRAAWDAALELAVANDDRWLRLELTINAHSIVLVLPGGVDWGQRLCRLAASWHIPALSPIRAALAWVEGYTHLLRGDLAEASVQIDHAMQINTQLGGIAKITLDAGFYQGVVAALHGDLETAERRLGALSDLIAQPALAVYARAWTALYYYFLGWLRISQGRLNEANAIADEMEDIANPHEWPTSRSARLLLRGLLAVEAGDSGTAESLLRIAVGEQQRFADSYIMGDARVLLAYNFLRAGRTSAALAPLAEALDAHVQRGTPGVLLLVGASVAGPLLRLAHDHHIQRATVERLLHALGEAVPPDSTTPPAQRVPPPTSADAPDVLTPREHEVLRLLASGASNQTIAEALVISLPTAKTHVAHILDKLGAANRTEAVACARDRGLI
jgi:LuxR family transcriptional regulator, maltose regulon positive regulatory protein